MDENLKDYIAPEFYEAVRRFGFHKVAAAIYGVNEINEKTASEIIGSHLMTRTAEWRSVTAGIESLRGLANKP